MLVSAAQTEWHGTHIAERSGHLPAILGCPKEVLDCEGPLCDATGLNGYPVATSRSVVREVRAKNYSGKEREEKL